MRIFDFVSVKLSFCLILGILIDYYLQPRTSIVIVLLIVHLILLILTKMAQKRRAFPFFGMTAMSTTMILGILILSFNLPKNQSHHYQGHLRSTNQLRLKITEVLKSNAYSNRYYATVKSINGKAATGSIILYITKGPTIEALNVDDELLTYSSIRSVSKPLNPHQFDYHDYLKKQGVYGQLRITENEFVPLQHPSKTIVGSTANFRKDLIEKLKKQRFGKEQFGVIQALLLGQRNDIAEETYSNYKNAGAVHILAVSGLHVGILLLLLQFLLQPLERLPKGKTIKLITIVVMLWSYAFVAGLSPSIVRAVTMFSFLAYALYLNRPTNTFNILALSMLFILLARPLFLFQVGFQMSYAAVFSIVWLYPKLQRFWFPKNRVLQKTWQLLSVSIAAQLGVLPISLFYFHQFPALFFVSNLVVVPFLGIILGFGILLLVLTFFAILPSFLVSFYNGLIGFMNSIIAWVAQQETFLFQDIPFDMIQLIIGYSLILGLVLVLSKLNFKNLFLFLMSTVAFSGYLLIQTWHLQQKKGVWLFHQTKNTVLLLHEGVQASVFTNDRERAESASKSYTIANGIDLISYDTIRNNYLFRDKKLIVLDSLGIYGTVKKPLYVLLTNSPRIHFERFLDSVRPQMILVDGSNYKSYIKRWKQTCSKRKLPFHYTGEKGAYKFEPK